MTGKQFAAALVALGYAAPLPDGRETKGTTAFATQLELSRVTVHRWASGKWPVPRHISALVKLMLKTNTKAEDLVT